MKKQTIKILGCPYDVKVVNEVDADNPDVHGHISYQNQIIKIKAIGGDYIKSVSVMHEVLHGIFFGLGHSDISDNEVLVDGLANALVQVLRENPSVVDMVRGVW
jgi:hypothetical protein